MIYIVRHGQTNYNVEGRYGGRIDILLNEKGILGVPGIAYGKEYAKFVRLSFATNLEDLKKAAKHLLGYKQD